MDDTYHNNYPSLDSSQHCCDPVSAFEAEIQQKRVDQLTKELTRGEFNWVSQGCFMEILMVVVEIDVGGSINKKVSVHMDLTISFYCWNVNLFSFWLGSVYPRIRSHASTQPFRLIFRAFRCNSKGYMIVSLFSARMLNHVVARAATPIFHKELAEIKKQQSTAQEELNEEEAH